MRALVLHAGLPGERRYPILGGDTTIGRTDENDIVMTHLSLSRHHARVRSEGDTVLIEDRDSKNGTWVNGTKVDRAEKRPLHHRDRVRLGDIELQFLDDSTSGLLPVADILMSPRTSSIDRLLSPGPTGLNIASSAGDKRDREKLQVLLDAAEQLLTIDTVDGILHRVVQLVRSLLDVDRIVVLLPNPATGELEERAPWSRLPTDGPNYSRSIARHVAERRTATLFSDPHSDERFGTSQSIVVQQICSAMAAPLIAHDKLHAVLYVDNLSVPNRFVKEDLQFLCGFANQAALAIENALLYERVERESALRQNLLRFFPDAIAQRLLVSDTASLAPVELEVTALFCDLVDFVGLGTRMSPRAVLDVLQVYLKAMEEVVFQYEGTMEKYIGDALMAVWGAPFRRADDPLRAMKAAIAMQRAMDAVNRRLAKTNLHLAVHIGLNTGPVCAGNIGSTRYLQYAAIGDATNIAARVCGKAGAGEIFITDATRRALGALCPPVEDLPPLPLKGRSEPAKVCRVRWQDLPG